MLYCQGEASEERFALDVDALAPFPKTAFVNGHTTPKCPVLPPRARMPLALVTGDYFCEEGDDFDDGGDAGGMGFSLGKGDVRGRREHQQEDEVAGGGGGGDGRGSRCGSDDAGGSRVGAFLAMGFADGFERLEDQEAGYAAFAAFLVRVLDQMP